MHRGIEIEYWLQTRNYIYIFITIWQQYKWLEKSLNSALSDTYSRMGFGAGHQKDKCIWNVVDFAIISCGHLVAEWSIPRDVAGGIPTGSRAQRSRERQGEAGRGRERQGSQSEDSLAPVLYTWGQHGGKELVKVTLIPSALHSPEVFMVNAENQESSWLNRITAPDSRKPKVAKCNISTSS